MWLEFSDSNPERMGVGLNNYFGDGVTSQNNFFKIILNYDMVSDGVPISQNDLIKFYYFEMDRLYYSMMGLTCPIHIRHYSTEIPRTSPPPHQKKIIRCHPPYCRNINTEKV